MDERIVQLLEEQNNLLREVKREIELLVNLTSVVADTTIYHDRVGRKIVKYVESFHDRIPTD